MGFPDFYRYVDRTINPIGIWDLMSNDMNPPQSISAYAKYRYTDWVPEIPTIITSGTFTLNPVTTHKKNHAYKILSPNSSFEYFVVEYRNNTTGLTDSELPGAGLLIYRVNPNLYGNASGPPDEMYVFRPFGTTTVDGSITNAYFSLQSDRTSFNNITNPHSFLSSGLPASIDIFNIGYAGETITFSVDLQEMILAPPHNLSANVNDNFVALSWDSPLLPDFGEWISQSSNWPIFMLDWDDITVAHRFTSEQLSQKGLGGGYLSKIHFRAGNMENDDVIYTVKVWLGGGLSDPGTLVHEQVVKSINPLSFIDVNLTKPIHIPETQELKIGLHVKKLVDEGFPLFVGWGYVNDGFGNLVLSGNSFITNNEIEGNFYIRGFVNTKNNIGNFEGFNVYRGDNLLTIQPITDLSFVDSQPFFGLNTYSITACYGDLGESIRTSISVDTSVSEQYIVAEFLGNKLFSNFPNPFNLETVIRFQVSGVRSQVSINIFNIRGQLLRGLVSGVWDQGSHSIIWDGKDDYGRSVGSGVYFYQMRTDDFVETRRMLLLK